MTELFVFIAAVAAFAIGGVAIGMLVAPRLARLMEPPDEDDSDGSA